MSVDIELDKTLGEPNIIMEGEGGHNENDIGDLTRSDENDMQMGEYNARKRQMDEGDDWTIYSRHTKRQVRNNIRLREEDVQVCVTCKSQLPKQFALAKLFKEKNINDVVRVKYVNPYKIIITFGKESSLDTFVTCQYFLELEWRIQKTWEVGMSYGIIKDIDLNLSNEELTESITSDTEITSVKRLQRRNQDGSGWIDSESVRLCFKGSSLPQHVYIWEMRVKVEQYTFPVTQCSRCWRFGHTVKLCPSNKIICPKCGQYHANCEAQTYKCANCSGNHMALAKSCPVFLREKRLREIMSEFNCSYRRALTVYVPPTPAPLPTRVDKHNGDNRHRDFPALPGHSNRSQESTSFPTFPRSYTEAVEKGLPKRSNLVKAKTNTKKKTSTSPKSQQMPHSMDISEFDISCESEASSSDGGDYDTRGETTTSAQVHWAAHSDDTSQKKSESFSSLLKRLKSVVFSKEKDFKSKLKCVVKECIEWFIVFVVGSISDLGFLKNIIQSWI